jgi:hypothetical protein
MTISLIIRSFIQVRSSTKSPISITINDHNDHNDDIFIYLGKSVRISLYSIRYIFIFYKRMKSFELFLRSWSFQKAPFSGSGKLLLRKSKGTFTKRKVAGR